jgi:hypothetical protein
MTRVPRYGDEGTIVTTREKAVAALFIVGIAALLLGRVVTGPEERAGTNAQARAATPAPSQTRAADTGSDDTSAAHFHAAATGHD